ncbi:MAG: hypothetical protein ACFB2W_10155 [Leptolyngbyaceae cyanobacterium]
MGLAQQRPVSSLLNSFEASPSSLLISHQGMLCHVEISLEYGLKSDSRPLARNTLINEAVELLISYPNQYDYWEIVNLAITQQLLETYPQLEHVTLRLEMLPHEQTHYYRVSTVTRWADGRVNESWRFEIEDMPIQGRPSKTVISYVYKDAAGYPDYLDIHRQLMDYLASPVNSDAPSEQLEATLAQHLLESYAEAIAQVTVELRSVERLGSWHSR